MKTKTEKNNLAVDLYETEIEYTCPVRGLVKQKVKIKRLAPVEPSLVDEIRSSNSVTEVLDRKYSGLFITDDSLEQEEES